MVMRSDAHTGPPPLPWGRVRDGDWPRTAASNQRLPRGFSRVHAGELVQRNIREANFRGTSGRGGGSGHLLIGKPIGNRPSGAAQGGLPRMRNNAAGTRPMQTRSHAIRGAILGGFCSPARVSGKGTGKAGAKWAVGASPAAGRESDCGPERRMSRPRERWGIRSGGTRTTQTAPLEAGRDPHRTLRRRCVASSRPPDGRRAVAGRKGSDVHRR